MNENKRKSLTFVNLALALANDYKTLYVISSDDDSYIEYAPHGDDKELVPVSSGDDFYSDSIKNAREQVWPADLEFFLNAI